MFEFFLKLLDPQVIIVIITAVSTAATIYAFVIPVFTGDKLNSRMKQVATERDRMRAERLAELQGQSGRLRENPTGFMTQVVRLLNLQNLLETEDTRKKLAKAGMRGQGPVMAFLFFRLATPIACTIAAFFYLFVVNDLKSPAMLRVIAALCTGYLGFYLPNVFVSNLIQRRQIILKRSFPDALDLLQICVQSGMSSEGAFAKVSREIASQSIALAEELTLLTAELSFLPDRTQAYQNLADRTGITSVKAVVVGLIQAEKYGTSLSQTLRVLSQEMRDERMSEAEKKAAALPPKLTVPMISFFLPVLFIVILGPSVIKVMAL